MHKTDQAGRAARARLQRLQVIVINCINDSKSITSVHLAECIKMHKVNEEALVLKIKFIRLDLYQIWKAKFPKLAKTYYQVESKEDPLTNVGVLGVRVSALVAQTNEFRSDLPDSLFWYSLGSK